MSGRERRQRERNRVGESRAVRSLNSLQPLVRATPTPLTSTFFRLAEGQSINILMGLNCRFYPSNDGGSAARSSEPLIAPLSFLSVSAFSPFCLFVQISRIRKNVKKKKKTVFTRLSALPRAPWNRAPFIRYFSARTSFLEKYAARRTSVAFLTITSPRAKIYLRSICYRVIIVFSPFLFFFFFFFLFFGQIDVFP